ncbi:MAG: SWIM zinc finger family protein [Alphaproteobacteria bacterium]|nr:SWIM zinc finger family protein [Alphaproteobacteria bacterium]
MAIKDRKKKRKKRKSGKSSELIKIPSGWSTTDEDEIQRRRLRAETETMEVINVEPEIPYFGTYRVHSKTGQVYRVEIRSLGERLNSCSCIDYEINGLGTCKHIEKVLLIHKKKGKRNFKKLSLEKSPRFEIYVDPFDLQVKFQEPLDGTDSISQNSYAPFKEFFFVQWAAPFRG